MSLEEAIEQAVARGVRKALSEVRDDADDLLTPKEAAALAKVSQPTIRHWVEEGLLPRYGSSKTLRVRRGDVRQVKPRTPAQAKTAEEIADELMGTGKRR